MAQVQITWQRTCEYVATVDTEDLRELVAQLPGFEQDIAERGLDELEGRSGSYSEAPIRELGWVISNTETGREYLGALADDNPELLGGTGAPKITDLKPA